MTHAAALLALIAVGLGGIQFDEHGFLVPGSERDPAEEHAARRMHEAQSLDRVSGLTTAQAEAAIAAYRAVLAETPVLLPNVRADVQLRVVELHAIAARAHRNLPPGTSLAEFAAADGMTPAWRALHAPHPDEALQMARTLDAWAAESYPEQTARAWQAAADLLQEQRRYEEAAAGYSRSRELAIRAAAADDAAHAGPALLAPDSLAEMRAPQAAQAYVPSIQVDERGQPAGISEDGMTDMGAAMRLLRGSFEINPCIEYETQDTIRVAFSIQANERLVDALKRLRVNSSDAFVWRLLEGRLVFSVSSHGASRPSSPLEREVELDCKVVSFGDFFARLEAAYNDRYADFPLLVQSGCLELLPDQPIAPDAAENPLVFSGAYTVRQTALALLARIANPKMGYSGSVLRIDVAAPEYCRLSIKIDRCRDDFESGEERRRFIAGLDEAQARLESYFEAAARRQAQAAAPADAKE